MAEKLLWIKSKVKNILKLVNNPCCKYIRDICRLVKWNKVITL